VQKLDAVVNDPALMDIDVRVKPPRSHRKWPPVRLADWVSDRVKMRVLRTGFNHFKREYVGPDDRESFRAFLLALIQGDSSNGYSKLLAQQFRDVLAYNPNSGHSRRHQNAHMQKWLKAYFQDEPDMQDKFYTWVKKAE
jgi:hypothetical protein